MRAKPLAEAAFRAVRRENGPREDSAARLLEGSRMTERRCFT